MTRTTATIRSTMCPSTTPKMRTQATSAMLCKVGRPDGAVFSNVVRDGVQRDRRRRLAPDVAICGLPGLAVNQNSYRRAEHGPRRPTVEIAVPNSSARDSGAQGPGIRSAVRRRGVSRPGSAEARPSRQDAGVPGRANASLPSPRTLVVDSGATWRSSLSGWTRAVLSACAPTPPTALRCVRPRSRRPSPAPPRKSPGQIPRSSGPARKLPGPTREPGTAPGSQRNRLHCRPNSSGCVPSLLPDPGDSPMPARCRRSRGRPVPYNFTA